MLDTVTEGCSSILQVLAPPDGEERKDHLKLNYTSKQLEDLHSKYQVIAWSGHAQGLGLHSALFHKLWDEEERLLHINVSELRAVQMMLCSLGEALLGQVIWLESDNTMAVTYINKEGLEP